MLDNPSTKYPGLTVVIPLYNKRTTVGRALKSVLDQLDEGDRVIVVDDGSVDGSAEASANINDPRLSVLSQENQGVSAARNRGIDAAQTEHVAFLDADDWWLSGAVSEFKRLFRKAPECIMSCVGHVRCAPGEVPEELQSPAGQEDEFLEGAAFIYAYSREQLINSSAVCVKKTPLQEIGGFPEGVLSGEDVYLWLRMALKGGVAVSRRRKAVIERAAPGPGSPTRDAVPFHVRWFSDSGNLKGMSRKDRKAVGHFIFYRGINMCAGEVMAKRRGNAIRQIRAITRIRPSFGFVGALIVISPTGILKLLYSRKHSVKD